jgi:hypothetical protein
MDDPADRQPQAPKSLAVALAVVLVAVTVFLLTRGGSDETTPSDPGTQAPVEVTVADVCANIPLDLAVRTEALQRAADEVRADAEALAAAGDTENAALAADLADTLAALAEANEAQGDTAELLGQLTADLDALGC